MADGTVIQPLAAAPTVGVVIPAYNAAQWIATAVESALAQTWPVKEILVVDDGSSDDSRSALRAYEGRIQYIRIENSGPARARNLGLQALSSDLVAFLDADDVWVPEKTARQIDRMRQLENCALVYCHKSLIDSRGRDLGPFPQTEFPDGNLLKTLIRANYISTTTAVLARRDALVALGGFREGQDFRNCEDYELWMRIAARYAIGAIAEPLVRYRIHETNATRNMASRYVGMLAALDSITNDLQQQNLLDGEIEQLIRARRLDTHAQFARGFLYASDYDRARAAANSFEQLAGRSAGKEFVALSVLPDWVFGMLRNTRRWVHKVF